MHMPQLQIPFNCHSPINTSIIIILTHWLFDRMCMYKAPLPLKANSITDNKHNKTYIIFLQLSINILHNDLLFNKMDNDNYYYKL